MIVRQSLVALLLVGCGCSAFAQTNQSPIFLSPASGSGSWFWIDNPGNSGNYLRISNGTSPGGAGPVVINATGQVGIGTTTPAAPLTVAAGAVSTAYPVLNALILQPAGGAAYTANGASIYFDSVTNHGIQPIAGIWSSLNNGGDGGVDYNGSPIFATVQQGNSVPTEGMRLDMNGNLGVGTTSHGSKLEVDGSVTLTANSGASITFPDASVQSTAWNGVIQGGDYAESVDVSGNRAEYEPGDVLVIDPSGQGRFLKSSMPYATTVAGIYSTRPGIRGRRQATDSSHMPEEVPMAMIGVVPTKVTAKGGQIQPGDLLVTSSTAGYAMKGTDHSRMMGAIIGKAMGHLDSSTGFMEVLVSLQ